MTKDDILNQLRKKKYQARQLSPNAIVVSIEEAEKAVKKAFESIKNNQ